MKRASMIVCAAYTIVRDLEIFLLIARLKSFIVLIISATLKLLYCK